MAALDFPASPTISQTFTSGTSSWIWDGVSWNSVLVVGTSGFSGFSGGTGTNGATGTSGFSGAVGTSGFSGFSGAAGPSTAINATDDTTTTTLYPVMVGAAGSNQTPKVRTTATALSFNASTGALSATDFNSLSDANKKTNVKIIDNALSIVNQLRGVTFNWIETDRLSLGLIAQEVESVLPCLVATSNSGEKSISYGNIVGLLIEAVKEQQKEIQELKDKIENL